MGNHTIERENYLAEISELKICENDLGLPRELIDMYFQGGKMLKCPIGTSSPRASWCLGQCEKPRAAAQPISILNPISDDAAKSLGLKTTSETRKLQLTDEEEKERMKVWNPVFDEIPVIKLKPFEIAKVTMDFRDLPQGFDYNSHYAIVILGRSDEI